MRNFYDILLIISSFGFIYGGTRKTNKQKVIVFSITILLFIIILLLRENT